MAETLPADAPTTELLFQAGVQVAMSLQGRRVQVIGGCEVWGGLGASGVIRLSNSPLDRLHVRGRLDDDGETNNRLFEAGHKLRTHHHLAGLSGFAANDLLSSSGGSHPATRLSITETMESNRRSLRIAKDAMEPRDWLVVEAVVCNELTLLDAGRAAGFSHEKAAQAVALDRLRGGLAALAELWGDRPPSRPTAGEAANGDAVATAAA